MEPTNHCWMDTMDSSRLSYLDYIHHYSISILDVHYYILHEYFVLSICMLICMRMSSPAMHQLTLNDVSPNTTGCIIAHFTS